MLLSVDAGQAHLAGIALLLVLPLGAAAAVALALGGYGAGFWYGRRDRKLDHIAAHRRAWLWMHGAWVATLAAATAGFAAFAALLARAGQEALAGVGLGLVLLGVLGWLVGVLLQVAAGDVAAQARRARGATPDWLEPLWAAVGWAEVAYIVCTGIGYVAWGAAILDSGFPADWAGSVAVVLGGASVAAVALVPARATIPEVPLVVPIVLGIALVLV